MNNDNPKSESSLLKPPSTNDRSTGNSSDEEHPIQQAIITTEDGIAEKAIDKEDNLIDLHGTSGHNLSISASNNQMENKDEWDIKQKEKYEVQNERNLTTPGTLTKTVTLVKTSCGDAHNVGLDDEGRAYSLPSPLDFDPFPSGSTHKV